MKLILQECRPKWSLNQHHKNKRLLVQVVSHAGLPRHFNVFGQRKWMGTQFGSLHSGWSGLHYSIMQSDLFCFQFFLAGSISYNITITSATKRVSVFSVIMQPVPVDWEVSEEWTYLWPLWGQRSATLWFQEALPHDWGHPAQWTLAEAGEKIKKSVFNMHSCAKSMWWSQRLYWHSELWWSRIQKDKYG